MPMNIGILVNLSKIARRGLKFTIKRQVSCISVSQITRKDKLFFLRRGTCSSFFSRKEITFFSSHLLTVRATFYFYCLLPGIAFPYLFRELCTIPLTIS